MSFTVLNTRPKEQAKDTAQIIKALGGHSIDCPSLVIKPVTTDWIKKVPSQCDLVIFISSNAVKYSVEKLLPIWQQNPTIAAIGKKTAHALQSFDLTPDFIATPPTSEGLLTTLAEKTFRNVLLVKGTKGRRKIEQFFTKQQGHFTSVVVYEQHCPEKLPTHCKNLWKNQHIDIILGTSIEGLQNLFSLFRPAADEWLTSTPWLVLSERIKKACEQKKIKNIIVAKNNQLLLGLKDWAKKQEETVNG